MERFEMDKPPMQKRLGLRNRFLRKGKLAVVLLILYMAVALRTQSKDSRIPNSSTWSASRSTAQGHFSQIN